MPELPDVVVYLEALEPRIMGQRLEGIRLASPFLLRSADPPLTSAFGHHVTSLSRRGKRIAIGLDGDLHLLLHLMIAGRLRWRPLEESPAAIPGRIGRAAFDFPNGTLLLTEASPKHRVALHLVRGSETLEQLVPAALEVLDASRQEFGAALRRENHTLKRALTDPRILSGIGNAYSDEILHAARLSPLALSGSLPDADMDRLYDATRRTLMDWIDRLRRATGEGFPEKVTAFREGMAVHGRYRLPCPVCGSPVQRIRYAENEANYCATCQTGGKVYADRSLSRLLRDDWPRSLEEWEARVGSRRSPA
jgi:formamidopyrimidine-DNA glycosylase